jgi:ABC-type uncharacterized transport system auxiliary subunit
MKGYEKFSHGKGQKFATCRMVIAFILSMTLLMVASPGWSKETFDMILNSDVYPYPSYSFKAHFRQSLQIKVVQDNRPDYERINTYGPSNHVEGSLWAEPIAVMVEKVLEREFLLSNLFDSVTRHDNRSSLLLEIDLNSFSGAWAAGRSGLKPIFTISGDVELNASLISRREGKILLIKNYREKAETEISQFRDKEAYAAVEAAKALKRVTANLMNDIKGRLERLETSRIEAKKDLVPTQKPPPERRGTEKKPKKRTVLRKELGPIVLEPVGPK